MSGQHLANSSGWLCRPMPSVPGLMVYQPTSNASLQHFDRVGYVTAGTMVITIGMMFFINRQVASKMKRARQAP